jgi:histidine ammonia-lyase
MNKIVLDGFNLKPEAAFKFSKNGLNPTAKFKIEIHPKAEKKIIKSQNFVASVVEKQKPVYGINTGFGKFAEVSISLDKIEQLQKNLILSHSCGMGDLLTRDLVLMMWVIRLNILCRGHSGVRLETIHTIIQLLESGVLSCVPSRGSVGASGDLSPSAHASLVLLGEGDVTVPDGNSFAKISAKAAHKRLGIKPISLAAKEGLALINGTQLTTGIATQVWFEAMQILEIANFALALSIEGLRASHRFLDKRILENRNQRGALECGLKISKILGPKTEISESHKNCGRVQDAYSLRCAPQVHGAIWNDLNYLKEIITGDLNSSTDNPLLFPDSQDSISGGNFHAIYTARALDQMASALTTLSNISERRVALAMSPESSRLPAFLIKNGGLNSGLMMAHVTAAALVSESKSLCMPASVDSISTSDDREDHVSMGPGAGFKALQILENTRRVLAIEILTAVQAIHLLRPLKSSPQIETFISLIEKEVPELSVDRMLYKDMQYIESCIKDSQFLEKVGIQVE